MEIRDVSTMDNSVVAFCTGEDLPLEGEISTISVEGKNMYVTKYSPSISFSGRKCALLIITSEKNPKDVPLGEMKIIA